MTTPATRSESARPSTMPELETILAFYRVPHLRETALELADIHRRLSRTDGRCPVCQRHVPCPVHPAIEECRYG